jgi:hypothetical protein
MMRIYSDVFPDKFLSFLWEKSFFSSNSITFANFFGRKFRQILNITKLWGKKNPVRPKQGPNRKKGIKKKNIRVFFVGRGWGG